MTLVLCWSAAEAAHYLELYKSYEHASFTAIKGAQSNTYAEKLVDFVTVPRSVNKADAVALVSTFGSLKAAVNADPETVGVIGGWGEKKVKAWCKAVDEPFRAKKAAKRTLAMGQGSAAGRRVLEEAIPLSRVPLRDMASVVASMTQDEASTSMSTPAPGPQAKKPRLADPAAQDEDAEDAMLAAAIEESRKMAEEEARVRAGGGASSSKQKEQLTDGVAAALARLRQNG